MWTDNAPSIDRVWAGSRTEGPDHGPSIDEGRSEHVPSKHRAWVEDGQYAD